MHQLAFDFEPEPDLVLETGLDFALVCRLLWAPDLELGFVGPDFVDLDLGLALKGLRRRL